VWWGVGGGEQLAEGVSLRPVERQVEGDAAGSSGDPGGHGDQVVAQGGGRLINRDVPQEVVRKILDHDSPEMTAHYARLHDTTVREHWERAHKVNTQGETVTLDPNGPLAQAVWAK
jgi:hypothetical protein